MDTNYAHSNETPDADDSTSYSCPTSPPESTFIDPLGNYGRLDFARLGYHAVPCPDSSFIIRSIACGRVITLRRGQIELARPDGRGEIQWECIENKGWLGFRNYSSNKLLGYDGKQMLCCTAVDHKKWECFVVMQKPGDGHILIMTHYEDLVPVGIVREQGVEKLGKIVGKKSFCGMTWEFVKVEHLNAG